MVTVFLAFTALAYNNSYRISVSAVPFRSSLPSLSAMMIAPAKEFIVCISTELFCRPFPTVNSLYTGACILIRYELPFATPCAIHVGKCIAVKHIAGYRKCLLRLRFPPSLLLLVPSLTVTLCFHSGECFRTMPLFHNYAEQIEPIHWIYSPDTLPYCLDILPRSIHPLRRISPL